MEGMKTGARLLNSRAQAVVMDAIFFMIICGVAGTFLLWAGSTYGSTTYEAYKYMYLNDYQTSTLAVLGQVSYNVQIGATDVKRYWTDELGEYMLGNINKGDERHKRLHEEWHNLCVMAPAPLLLIVSSPSPWAENGYCPEAVGSECEHLFFSCGNLLDPTWTDDDGKNISLNESDGAGGWVVNHVKYPYYSSPLQSKMCKSIRCDMMIKLYY